jgi:DNA-binding transcriptional MocR family regulator
MPANHLFPIDVVNELWSGLSTDQRQAAMQYGPTTGYPPLLESLKEYLASKGLPLEGQGLMITTGAQQALNLAAKVLLDPGDVVVTENPSFIGALAAFLSYLAKPVGVPLDNDGIDVDCLKATLSKEASRVKAVYLNPFFQNPSGILYSEDRKQEVIELLCNKNICLIEDDPYGELCFNEADKPRTRPLKAMANESLPICYAGSFAKIFGPGLRLGWLLGPAAIIDKCELAKQSMDACSPSFTQVLAHAYLSKGKLPDYLGFVRQVYARRAAIMLGALDATMPEGTSWTRPRGGFYIWVTLPKTIDATAVFNEAIKHRAAFVIGSAFDPSGKNNGCFRLAFSHTPEDRIAEGISIIATAIKSLL